MDILKANIEQALSARKNKKATLTSSLFVRIKFNPIIFHRAKSETQR